MKRTRKKFIPRFLQKTIAIFLCFSLTLLESMSYAAQSNQSPRTGNQRLVAFGTKGGEGGQSKNSGNWVQVSGYSISIPSDLGTIEESVGGKSGKTILYIQDAHDSLEAQENIAKIIDDMVEHYGVRTVYEEGYEGPVPTDRFFGFIKDPAIKTKVSYFLLDKLRIGGAEYAHINRKKDFRLIGADNIKLHLENIAWYQENAKDKEETEKDLDALYQEIQKLAGRFFPEGLKKWMKLKDRFEKNQLGLLDYLKRVKDDFSQGIGLAKVYKEPFLTVHAPNIAFLLAAENTKDPAVIEQAQNIDSKILFQEIYAMENDFSKAFLRNERDQKIFQYHKALTLLKRLNHIEVTPAEYEAVKENLKDLSTQSLAQFIADQTKKSIVLSKRWEDNIQKAIRFYEIARARDSVIETRVDEFIANADEKIAVLVFGGFHRDRIKNILQKKSLSFHMVMPALTQIDDRHQNLYRQLMSRGYQPFEFSPYLSRAARYPPIYVDAYMRNPTLARKIISILEHYFEKESFAVGSREKMVPPSRGIEKGGSARERGQVELRSAPLTGDSMDSPSRAASRAEVRSEKPEVSRRDFLRIGAGGLWGALFRPQDILEQLSKDVLAPGKIFVDIIVGYPVKMPPDTSPPTPEDLRKIQELTKYFPRGIRYEIPTDAKGKIKVDSHAKGKRQKQQMEFEKQREERAVKGRKDALDKMEKLHKEIAQLEGLKEGTAANIEKTFDGYSRDWAEIDFIDGEIDKRKKEIDKLTQKLGPAEPQKPRSEVRIRKVNENGGDVGGLESDQRGGGPQESKQWWPSQRVRFQTFSYVSFFWLGGQIQTPNRKNIISRLYEARRIFHPNWIKKRLANAAARVKLNEFINVRAIKSLRGWFKNFIEDLLSKLQQVIINIINSQYNFLELLITRKIGTALTGHYLHHSGARIPQSRSEVRRIYEERKSLGLKMRMPSGSIKVNLPEKRLGGTDKNIRNTGVTNSGAAGWILMTAIPLVLEAGYEAGLMKSLSRDSKRRRVLMASWYTSPFFSPFGMDWMSWPSFLRKWLIPMSKSSSTKNRNLGSLGKGNKFFLLETAGGVLNRSLNRFASQRRVASQDIVDRHASGEVFEDGRNGNTGASENRFPVVNVRMSGDISPKRRFLFHTEVKNNTLIPEGQRLSGHLLSGHHLRSEVRSDLDEVLDHEGWKHLTATANKWLGIPHVAERILWNYREILEAAAQVSGFKSFLQYLDYDYSESVKEYRDMKADDFRRSLWEKLPKYMWDYEPDMPTVLDAEDSRFSEFFRYPQQYAWFYTQLLDWIAAEKKKGDKRALKIDLIGPAYFQEPLTLLALIRTAYEVEGVALEDIPLGINVFDKEATIFEIFKKGGLVYRKEAIEKDLSEAHQKLVKDSNLEENPLLRDWTRMEQHLFELLTPVTHSETQWQVVVPDLKNSQTKLWFDRMHFTVDYKTANLAQDVAFVFMNSLFYYVKYELRKRVITVLKQRLNRDGIVFSTTDGGAIGEIETDEGFVPHPSLEKEESKGVKDEFKKIGAWILEPHIHKHKGDSPPIGGQADSRSEVRVSDQAKLQAGQVEDMLQFAHSVMEEARKALDKILGGVRKKGIAALKTEQKGDSTIVTIADRTIQNVVLKRIRQHYPNHYLLAEEEMRGEAAQENKRNEKSAEFVWVLDPIDGTRAFSEGSDEYAVSLALYHRGLPVLGLAYSPRWNGILEASENRPGAYLNVNGKRALLKVQEGVPERPKALIRGKTKLAVMLKKILREKKAELVPSKGSTVIKMASMLTEPDRVDFYANLRGRKAAKGEYLWDIAAIAYILEKAGVKSLAFQDGEIKPMLEILKGRLLNPAEHFVRFQSLAGSPAILEQILPQIGKKLSLETLLREGQAYLDYLAYHKVDKAAPPFSIEDVKKFNLLILTLGSPSPQTFVNLAREWKQWNRPYQKVNRGEALRILASTGLGRGTVRLIDNTQAYYDEHNAEAAAKFQKLRAKEGAQLTEAKTIQFILTTEGVPKSAISLEEKSANTFLNMVESKKVIKEELLPKFADPSKALKVMVITDGFHRLRSLLQALEHFKEEGWHIAAPALYVPILKNMTERNLVEYLEFLFGYPEGMGGENQLRSSEIERIHRDFPGISTGVWTVDRVKALREVFQDYLQSRSEVRTEEKSVIEEVLKQYDLGKIRWKRHPAPEKENVIFVRSDKGKFVLKSPRYRNTSEKLKWEASLLNRLGNQVARIQQAKERANFVLTEEGQLFVLYEDIRGKKFDWGEVEGKYLVKAAEWLAGMHKTLENFIPEGKPYSPAEHPQVIGVLHHERGVKRLEQLHHELTRRGPPSWTPIEKYFRKHYDFIQKHLEMVRSRLKPEMVRKLPQTIVHGDFHQGNVRFSPGGKVRAFDFEYAAWDARLYDLANGFSIRYPKEGGKEKGSLAFDKVETFVLAYHKKNPLTALELELLPEIYRLWYLEITLMFVEQYAGKSGYLPYLKEQLSNLRILDSFDWKGLANEVQKATPLRGSESVGRDRERLGGKPEKPRSEMRAKSGRREDSKSAQEIGAFNKLRNALLREAQALLRHLTQIKVTGAAWPFQKKDIRRFNLLLLVLGSPSPETFVNTASAWKEWNGSYQSIYPEYQVKIVASTGRGRGAPRLINNTQAYYDKNNPQLAKEFLDLRHKEGEGLTEAKVIQFILEAGGVLPEAVVLEEKSVTTYQSMIESAPVIKEKIIPSFPEPSKPLKILVITDGFHRLRALLLALDHLKKDEDKWHMAAPALYVPRLKDMEEKPLLDYLEFLIGFPEGAGGEERLRGSETERISKFYPGFKHGEWNVERVIKLRVVFKEYLLAKEKIESLSSSEQAAQKSKSRKSEPRSEMRSEAVISFLDKLEKRFTVFIDLEDLAALTEEQITEDYEKMALRHKNVSFVFYHDRKTLRSEVRNRLEKLQEQLGSHRIVITDDESNSVFRRPWAGKWIHVSKPRKSEIASGFRASLPRRKGFYFFRYLGDETGVVPVALLIAEAGLPGFQNKVIDFSMVSERIQEEVRRYLASLVIGRAA